MTQMYVIGEDDLCCSLGERLVLDVMHWSLPIPPTDTRGVTKLVGQLDRYIGLAKRSHVLCVADSDGKCAVDLLSKWLPSAPPPRFNLRLAVSEAESWLMADRASFARYFEVRESDIPESPDSVPDAKRRLLALAAKSKRRQIRAEVVSSSDPTRQGVGYRLHLRDFVTVLWQPLVAADRSPSLARAVRRLKALARAEI